MIINVIWKKIYFQAVEVDEDELLTGRLYFIESPFVYDIDNVTDFNIKIGIKLKIAKTTFIVFQF